MEKETIFGRETSRVAWENLEDWVRQKVQGFTQSLLDEEITELLAREKSAARGCG